jgi:ribosomal protein S18 acetylase RimI-like enzyme
MPRPGIARKMKNKIEFREVTSADWPEIAAMMNDLYLEDPSVHVSLSHFAPTLRQLTGDSQQGRIHVFTADNLICGYAVLIPFWSNEFGGNIVHIDEIYVKAAQREKGIAHRFFENLELTQPFSAVCFQLEVTPNNERAARLYRALGFIERTNAPYIRKIAKTK